MMGNQGYMVLTHSQFIKYTAALVGCFGQGKLLVHAVMDSRKFACRCVRVCVCSGHVTQKDQAWQSAGQQDRCLTNILLNAQ